jgi:hypothetical protein
VTLAAAAASFRFVEQPVLEGRVPWVGLRPGRVALAAVVAIAVTGTTAVVATRLPGGLGEQFAERGDRACPGERPGALVSCVRADGGPGAPTLAVLGDSTARALAAGLDEAAPARGLTWVQAAWQRCTATGLLVVPNGSPEPDAPARTCHEKADAAIDAMLARNRPSVVLVAEFWSHHQPFLVDGVRLEPGTPAHAAAVRRELTGLVDRVSAAGGRTALLELPPPGRGLGASVAAGRPAGTTQDAGPPERLRSGYNAVLAGVAGARPAAAAVVSVTDVVCAAPGCGAVQDGVLVRTDRVHYSGAFSRRLAPVLLDRIDASPVGPLRARG